MAYQTIKKVLGGAGTGSFKHLKLPEKKEGVVRGGRRTFKKKKTER